MVGIRTLAGTLIAVAFIFSAGCRGKAGNAGEPLGSDVKDTPKTASSQKTKEPAEKKVDGPPSERLEEELRSGAVQLQVALSSIEEALNEAAKLKGTLPQEIEEGMSEVRDSIDSAGELIGNASGEPLTLAEIEKDFSAADEDRLKRIEAANDAHADLMSAFNTVGSMAELEPKLSELARLLELAAQDVADGIGALGGKVEEA